MDRRNPYEMPEDAALNGDTQATPQPGGNVAARRVCGAKKKDGTPCQAPAMENGRCRIHGGLTPVGPALPQYQHGRYSKLLNGVLRDDFTDALNDPLLLDLSAEAALLELNLNEKLRQINEASVPAWSELLETVLELKAAIRAKDTDALSAALRQIEATARAGAGTDSAWRDVRGLLQERAKIVKAETARRKTLMLFVGAEQHRAALRTIAETVLAEIRDLPSIIAVLVSKEGRLNTEKLSYALNARIGRKLQELQPVLYPTPGAAIKDKEPGL